VVLLNTVGTRNKEQPDKYRIVPYCESFPCCESSSYIKLNFDKHRHSIIASFSAIAESFIETSTFFNQTLLCLNNVIKSYQEIKGMQYTYIKVS